MPTIDELRALFADLADRAPATTIGTQHTTEPAVPLELQPAGDRPRRSHRGRLIAAVAAGAALVALLIALPLTLTRSSPPASPPAKACQPSLSHQCVPGLGITFQLNGHAARGQLVTLRLTQGTPVRFRLILDRIGQAPTTRLYLFVTSYPYSLIGTRPSGHVRILARQEIVAARHHVIVGAWTPTPMYRRSTLGIGLSYRHGNKRWETDLAMVRVIPPR